MTPVTTIATLLSVILGGVGATLAGTPEGAPEQHTEEEHICGAALFDHTFPIEVVSTGCTEVEDFVFVLERGGPSEMDVQLIRIEPDFCDGLERTVTLYFDRSNVGLEGIEVINLQNPWRGSCPPRW